MESVRLTVRARLALFALLAVPYIVTGCASDEQASSGGDDDEACADEGDACECDDGESGEQVCDDGALTCVCDPARDGDDDDEKPAPSEDDDEGDDDEEPAPPKRDAASDGKPDASSAGRDASGATDSGKPATDGSSDPAPGDASTGGTTTPPTTGGGMEPKIPAVSGECPEFKTGTVTVMGTSGISMVAGPKKEGTGSILFYWHGTGSSWSGEGGSGRTLPRSVQTDITNNGGIIFAINGSMRTGGDCSGTGTFGRDDFKIADLIVACGVKNHGINPRRIYTTGCSAGGLQAGCMAASRPDYLAAALPNSGGTVGPARFPAGGYVPAVMTMYGPAARDMVIIAFENSSRTLMQAVKGAGGFAVSCNHGGGHCMAPAPLYESGWKFLLDHPYGTKPSPYAMALPSGFHSSCKVF